MKVIPPIDVIENNLLLWSSIGTGEGDPPQWVETTNYAIGDRVHHAYSKGVYEALVAGIDATYPSLNPTKWVRVTTMNRWAMFDIVKHQSGKMSSYLGNIIIHLVPHVRVSSVAILRFENVSYINIKVIDPLFVTIYENTYIPPPCCKDYVNFNLPVSYGNRIEVALIRDDTEKLVSVEHVVIGTAEYIGDVQRGITIDTLNFSNLERDDFGYTNIVRRRGVGTIDQKLFIPATMVEKVLQVREKLNAVAAAWISIDENTPDITETYRGPTTIFGIYRDFNIMLDSSIHATINLELEEI